ncbi:SRPBCC family protein [Lysobacter cavernae]|uniref:SRPBCC family protein n=1 Tax=Lysobacter cavernae TaxID=1685901 RepID=A0ABV7RPZ6_9GAMM
MNDFGTVIAPGTVRIERSLPGPIERVWDYLTESGKRASWLASGEMDQRVGGSVELVFHNSELTRNDEPPPAKYAQYAGESRMSGTITACEPPHLLAYTWGKESEVRFELRAQGDRVQLVVTHSRLPDRNTMLSVASGWHVHLGILIDRIEGREPPGFWATHTRLEAEYARRMPAD